MADVQINDLPLLALSTTDEFEIQRSSGGQSGKNTLQALLNLIPAATVAWGQITGTLSNQSDLQAALNAKADASALTSHVNQANIHFSVASIDHRLIQNIGINSHAQIDTHIATAGIHFTDAPADGQQYARINNGWQVVAGGGGGEANTASNLGTGQGVFSAKVGVDLRLKSLVGGTNVTLSSDANEITINATGTGATSLNELSDVTLSGVAEGQVLRRGATTWNNSVLQITDINGLQLELDNRYEPGDTLQSADGTAASPGLSFLSDTNTGFYREGANVIGVAVNGTKVIEFRADGIYCLQNLQAFQP